MPDWTPEIEVDRDLAARLIAEQFPELAGAPVEPLGVGWDNTVYAVDGAWAFRFPRREVAVPGVQREIAVLPRIAPRVPAPIPEPRWVGRPAPAFPWPFFGAPLLHGVEATVALDDSARERLARSLGGFLRALHGIPPADLPHDPLGRADMQRRVPFGAGRLDEVAAAGMAVPMHLLRAVLDEARRLPPSARRVTVHGDLHVRHLLVDAARADPLCGVIDWGDVCAGDPAIDLSVAWTLFAPPARVAFFAAYGPIEEDQALRARVIGLFLSATLAVYGATEGMGALRDEALAGLERLVTRADLGSI